MPYISLQKELITILHRLELYFSTILPTHKTSDFLYLNR